MSDQKYLVDSFYPHERQLAADIVACADPPVTSAKLRRILMLVLRAHYSHPDNYGEEFEHLKCLTWAPDGGTLRVGFYPDFDDTRPDDFPAVLVGFGGVEIKKMVIGDYLGQSFDMSRTDLIKDAALTLNVTHTAKQPGDAYDLADMSARVLTALAAPVAMAAGAISLDVTGYGEPSKETPAPDRHYTVAMNVRIGYNLLVSRSVESHRIRRIVSTHALDTNPPPQCH